MSLTEQGVCFSAIALPLFLRYVPRQDWLKHAVLALLGGVGYCTLAYVGFAYAPVSHAGVFVNGGIGFWTIVIMAFMTGFHIPDRRPMLCRAQRRASPVWRRQRGAHTGGVRKWLPPPQDSALTWS